VTTDARLVATARDTGWLLTSEQALAVVGRHAWDRAQEDELWVPIVPGHFRHAATPLTFEMHVMAAGAWLGGRGALFGACALHWLGVDIALPPKVEFLTPRRHRRIPAWVTLHTTLRWDRGDVINHRGVRTCTATRAIIDLASQTRSARTLERVIDEAIRIRRTSLPGLRRRLAALSGTGRHGCRLLRELLLDSGGESYLERRFLRLLRTNHLPRPSCQVVFRQRGTTVARVDFLFPGANVVVEVSGRLGHTSDRDRQRDARRRNHLQQAGQQVIEFTTADVIDDPAYVLATLLRALPVPSQRPVSDVTR
jgi:very-short-patch-repair endonuclease